MRPWAPLGALGTLAMLATLVGGCRGGLGTTCRCAADCRAGLVCSAEGENPLASELCYKPGVSGLCVESEDIDDSGAPVDLTEPPMYLDMPSKRDFLPSGSVSDSMTGTGTTGTNTTGTSTTGTTDATTGTTDATTGTGTTTIDTTTTGTTGTTGTSSSTSSSSSTAGSSTSGSGSSSSSTT